MEKLQSTPVNPGLLSFINTPRTVRYQFAYSPFFQGTGFRFAIPFNQGLVPALISTEFTGEPIFVLVAGDIGSEIHTSLFDKIDEVLNDPEMYYDGEERPEESVVKEVIELLRQTKPFGIRMERQSEFLPDPVIRPLDGAIRISWMTSKADVKLVLSKNGKYIFNEEIVGGERKNQDLTADVTKSSLARKLEWLISR